MNPFSHDMPRRIARLTLAAALAAWLASACTTVGPAFRAPAEPVPPAHWADQHAGSPTLAASAASEASPLPADRWQAFSDPALIALQARVRDGNADLATAALRLGESRVQRSIAAAQRRPQASVRAGASRQRQSESGSATRIAGALPAASREQALALISEPFMLYQAGFDASWELDLWGRVSRIVEAADADSEAARATLAGLRASLVAEVAREHTELRSTQRQIALLTRQRAVAADVLGLIDARVAGGLVDASTSLRQQSVLADLDARLPPLLDREAEAMRHIEWLCGERPGALAALLARRPADVGDERSPWPDLSPGVPSTLVARRPDIAAAAAKLHAATAEIGIAVADLYPRVTIGASFGSEATSVARFGDWGSRQWQVGPSLSLPIFDAGRRRSTVTLRELQQQEAAIAYQQVVLKAWHEVDAAITAYEAERKRERHLADKAHASDEALVLSRARFERGMTDALPQLDAERAQLDAERDLVESHGRVGSALVAVIKSLGDNDGHE